MKTFLEALEVMWSKNGPRGDREQSTIAYSGVYQEALGSMPRIIEKIARPTITKAMEIYPDEEHDQLFMLVYSVFVAGLITGMEMEKHE
jgi:hypothetical protein